MSSRRPEIAGCCERARERMQLVLDGGPLDATVRQALDEHRHGCAACRLHFAELSELQQSLRALAPAPFPDDALAAVFARTKTLRPQPRAWLDWRVAAAAAGLVLALWGAWTLRGDPASSSAEAPVAATTPADPGGYTEAEREQAIREARLALALAANALKRAERVGVREVEEVLNEAVSPALDRVPVQLPPARPAAGDSRT